MLPAAALRKTAATAGIVAQAEVVDAELPQPFLQIFVADVRSCDFLRQLSECMLPALRHSVHPFFLV